MTNLHKRVDCHVPAWFVASFLSAVCLCQTFGLAEEPASTGRALIVAVTNYPSLPESLHLAGPANDADLMGRLLKEKFGFQNENIVVLKESTDNRFLPTRDNIFRELNQLAESAQPNEQIVVFLAGHGSQQPDDDPNNPDDPETDGLDEVFLPRDIGEWVSEVSVVENAITDDDLRSQLSKIQESGAFVWLIVDSCHAGTMMRGSGEEVVRQIPTALLVPESAIANAKTLSTPSEPTHFPSTRESKSLLNLENVVAIYAAQSSEPTIEKRLPRGGNPRKTYGLLTYTLYKILTNTTSPLTYRELASRVQQQYAAWGRTFPTPLIEGGGCDKEVLGLIEWPQRSQIIVTKSSGKLMINMGSLHGLTVDSVLKVLDPSGSAGHRETHSYAKVKSVTALEAEIEPVDFQDKKANPNIPDNAVVEIAYIDFGLKPQLLAVDVSPADPLNKADARLLSNVKRAISDIEFPGVSIVENPEKSDWLLRVRDGEVYILPAAGLENTDKQTAVPSLFGPAARENPAKWIIDRLGRIHRARSLLEMATPPGHQSIGSGIGIDVELSLYRFSSPEDHKGEPVLFSERGRVLQPGDIIGFELTNKTQAQIDVTLLFIDSMYGITSYFPRPGTLNNNRLPAGKSVRTPRARVTDAAGMEHVLLIAVKGEGVPVDFSCLGQPSIERVQTRGAEKVLDSPLGRLFKNALYEEGSTRGLAMDVVDTYSVQVLSWTVGNSP